MSTEDEEDTDTPKNNNNNNDKIADKYMIRKWRGKNAQKK